VRVLEVCDRLGDACSAVYPSARTDGTAGPVRTFDFVDDPDGGENGIPDYPDLAGCDGSPWCSDCNRNKQIDVCDISLDLGADQNSNDRPDECEKRAGDLSCDGTVNLAEINPFVLGLTSPARPMIAADTAATA
jgi:hypothetical protein